jgi:hypothetical protein
MGGSGVSGNQLNTAVGSQANLAKSSAANANAQTTQANADQGAATGYYNNQMNNGLPFYNSLTDYTSGANAQAFAPQRAALLRQTSQYGNMPSGYRDSQMTNLGSQQARSFDSSMVQNMMAQQMAKNQGAAGMQGEQQIAGQQALGYGQLAGNANQSIMGAPRKPGITGAIGGAFTQAMNSGKIA